MSDSFCPICGKQYSSGGACECPQLTTNGEKGKWVYVEYIQTVDPETIRLRAELEKAEDKSARLQRNIELSRYERERLYDLWVKTQAERDEARQLLAGGKVGLLKHYIAERDEARQWARYYRWLFIGMLPPEKDRAEDGDE